MFNYGIKSANIKTIKWNFLPSCILHQIFMKRQLNHFGKHKDTIYTFSVSWDVYKFPVIASSKDDKTLFLKKTNH